MFLNKVFVLFTIFACNQFVQARINVAVDMSPRELQSLGAILVETYLEHNLIQRLPTVPNAILCFILRSVRAVYDFSFLTGSFICAGILTPIIHEKYVAPSSVKPVAVTTMVQEYLNPNQSRPKKCNHDFGCDRNICWRTCHSSAGKKDAWCYTAPDIKQHKYQQCIYAHDCSPCWECLGPCNA